MTQPIKYAKHKSNTRVWLTIAFVWIFSSLVGSPIMLGLNTPPTTSSLDPFECAFNNKYFVLFSSLCSFYIPCSILVVLYYRIFKVSHPSTHFSTCVYLFRHLLCLMWPYIEMIHNSDTTHVRSVSAQIYVR